MSANVDRDDDDPSGPTLAFTVTGLPTVPSSGSDRVRLWVTAPPIRWLKPFEMPVGAGIFGGLDHFALEVSPPAPGTLHEPPPADPTWSAFRVVIEGSGDEQSSPVIQIDLRAGRKRPGPLRAQACWILTISA